MDERRPLGSEHRDVPPIWRLVDSTEAVAALRDAWAAQDEAMGKLDGYILDGYLQESGLDG
jgi:hypothetical protein